MNEQLLRFVERIPAATVIYSGDAVVSTNRAHEKLTGYKTEEMIGERFNGHLTNGNTSIEMNYTKGGKPYFVFISIIGVIIDSQRYYAAIVR